MNDHRIKLASNIMDALECAKEAQALMPQLPADMKPIYFRILNAIYKIRDNTGNSRISDISKASGILFPNTTKLINELVDLHVVEKFTSTSDKRVVLVRTTKIGEQYIQQYIVSINKKLEEEFSEINESDCITMIETIQKVNQAIKKVYQNKSNEKGIYN